MLGCCLGNILRVTRSSLGVDMNSSEIWSGRSKPTSIVFCQSSLSLESEAVAGSRAHNHRSHQATSGSRLLSSFHQEGKPSTSRLFNESSPLPPLSPRRSILLSPFSLLSHHHPSLTLFPSPSLYILHPPLPSLTSESSHITFRFRSLITLVPSSVYLSFLFHSFIFLVSRRPRENEEDEESGRRWKLGGRRRGGDGA
ncbi:hypothetical protein BDY24DRAFT_380326 [Mrakia frigida]|uniref:uncharacterized protein n=1 Tax=Mrakia frigida TaxID=29902 RepID=UPI003FCC1BD7